jgi:hypothetical protein
MLLMKRVGGILFSLVVAAVLLAPLTTPAAYALTQPTHDPNAPKMTPPPDPLKDQKDSVCIAVPIFSGGAHGKCPAGQVEIKNSGEGGAIVAYLKLILQLMSLLIGGIIMLAIVISGISYITSAGDPARIKSAKKWLFNAITALVLYMLMFAILNFLIPGGVLGA